MNYSEDLLKKIEDLAGDMMAPSEISGILELDEDEFADEIHVKESPIRKAYLKGYLKTVHEMRGNIRNAAITGSPYSLQKSMELLERIADEISI